jgi:transcription termination factor Rho
MYLSELKALPVTQLVELAATLEIENASRLRKQELMFAILKKRPRPGSRSSVTACWRFCLMASAF